MPEQLVFDLPPHVSMGAEDFLVSDANRVAYETVCTPESWPEGKLILTGPAASGKSHLARVFAVQTSATVLQAAAMAMSPLPDGGAVVIEDIATLSDEAEEWLFHTHNRLLRGGGQLLITAVDAPTRWPLRLGDLVSRMQGTSVVRIDPPDDGLLLGVLLKHFADRQLQPSAPALDYLVTHMGRSFEAVRQVVADIDRTALANRRAITRDLAREVLDRGADGQA